MKGDKYWEEKYKDKNDNSWFDNITNEDFSELCEWMRKNSLRMCYCNNCSNPFDDHKVRK